MRAEGFEKRTELNGCHGTIAGVWAGLGRWPVRLVINGKTRQLSLKCDAVVLLPKHELQISPEAATTCDAPDQDPACEDREPSSLAVSTAALQGRTALVEDGDVSDEDSLAVDGDGSSNGMEAGSNECRNLKAEGLQMLLFLGCKFSEADHVRQALIDGAMTDVVDADGRSPLKHAITQGSAACVKLLLEAKARIDPELMFFAVEHPPVLVLLLDAKASPDGTAKMRSPLDIAGCRGQPRSVQLLLDAGARCDSDRADDDVYPAWVRLSMLLDTQQKCFDERHLECLHLLMQRDERLHSKECTAVEELEHLFCDMCFQGTPTSIKVLLDVGIDPDVMIAGFELPPLALACTGKSSGHLECVKVLLHGTPPTSQPTLPPVADPLAHSCLSPIASPASLLLGAGGANPALELDHPKYKTVIAAAAHFVQVNGGNDGNDGCLRLLIKALQRGHALGQSLPLSAVRFRHSPCVPPHLAHLVRVSQWERRSRWPRADTGSKACVAACSATT